MKLEDIKQYLLVNSLQYFVGDDIEVTDEVLYNLANRALYFYSQWRPLLFEEEIDVDSYSSQIKETPSGRRILNIQNLYFFDPILAGPEGAVTWRWDYNKDNGLFRTEVTGKYKAEMLVSPKLEDLDTSNVEFLDMVLALYMMYVGSSRKSFTFDDQPFQNDGADIYSDGKELWDNTLEKLQTEQDSWYMSVY